MNKEKAMGYFTDIEDACIDGGMKAGELVSAQIQTGMSRWESFTMWFWWGYMHLSYKNLKLNKVAFPFFKNAFRVLLFHKETKWNMRDQRIKKQRRNPPV